MADFKWGKGNGKIKDVLIIAVLGVVLCVAIWLTATGGIDSEKTDVKYTETESKLANLLEEIEGVGKAEVMVCETEECVLSAVIVCEGANDLKVNLHVREAVATALGIKQNNIKIYLKK